MARQPNREIIIYDKSGKARGEAANVIYHRTALGVVRIHDAERVSSFAMVEEPVIDTEIF
jgi:hypothetical protein